MSACQNKPSLLEKIRISHPNNGVVAKFVKRTSAPLEEMDADLQKFWNVYRP